MRQAETTPRGFQKKNQETVDFGKKGNCWRARALLRPQDAEKERVALKRRETETEERCGETLKRGHKEEGGGARGLPKSRPSCVAMGRRARGQVECWGSCRPSAAHAGGGRKNMSHGGRRLSLATPRPPVLDTKRSRMKRENYFKKEKKLQHPFAEALRVQGRTAQPKPCPVFIA